MKIPFTIVRKRPYGFKDEISVQQNTGYSKTKLYINGIKKSDKIIIVDDILSTGGTLEAILISFQKIGVNIKGIFVVIDKGNSIDVIRNKYSIIIKSLIRVSIKNEKMTIKN